MSWASTLAISASSSSGGTGASWLIGISSYSLHHSHIAILDEPGASHAAGRLPGPLEGRPSDGKCPSNQDLQRLIVGIRFVVGRGGLVSSWRGACCLFFSLSVEECGR